MMDPDKWFLKYIIIFIYGLFFHSNIFFLTARKQKDCRKIGINSLVAQFYYEKSLVLNSVVMHGACLAGEHEHDFTAIAMFHIIVDIKFGFTDFVEIMIAEM